MTQLSRFWSGTTTGDAGEYSDTLFADVLETFTLNAKQGSSNLAIGGVQDTGSSGSYALRVYQNSTPNLSVRVDKGIYWILGRYYESTAIETLNISANSSGNTRIDSVVLSVNYSAQTIRLGIVEGTPNASPVAPTLTQTQGTLYQYRLANVTVTNGTAQILDANIDNLSNFLKTYNVNSTDNLVNVWTANTNTKVTLTNNTADQLVGLSITFTPSGSKVFFTYSYSSQYGTETGTLYHQAGYKVNSGAITYIGEDAATSGAGTNYMTTYHVLGVTVTAGVSNTITMYMKTGAIGNSTSYYWGRILVMEQAN